MKIFFVVLEAQYQVLEVQPSTIFTIKEKMLCLTQFFLYLMNLWKGLGVLTMEHKEPKASEFTEQQLKIFWICCCRHNHYWMSTEKKSFSEIGITTWCMTLDALLIWSIVVGWNIVSCAFSVFMDDWTPEKDKWISLL